MSIIVDHITKKYGKQKALDDVSFRVDAGEVVGLLGPNGAGKSTMMKIITCFIPPTSGTVSVYGHDIFEDSIEVRKRVGYLPENNPMYHDLYVKEYLEFVAGMYKIDNKNDRVEEMIEITGLEPERTKKIGALSKGYRQRVGLAQALIHDPEVLILDEPTSGLDPNQLADIRMLIKNIGKTKTIMLSTHIMQEVEAVCDRVIIIDRGRIVADDSTENLSALGLGSNRIRVEFNKKVNIADLRKIPGVEDAEERSPTSFELLGGEGDIREQVFQFAVKNNLVVLSMQYAGRGIEEVFQQLTKGQAAG
jgi:ABC-2 type transport system ATP-binding protein